MNLLLQRKKRELLEKYDNPKDRNDYNIALSKFHQTMPLTYGVIADNKDPECLGRLKVMLPLIGMNSVSPWYQVAGNKKNKSGFWALPEIGTQVVVCFPNGNLSRGIILGCIYDEKHLPPKHDTDNPSKSQFF